MKQLNENIDDMRSIHPWNGVSPSVDRQWKIIDNTDNEGYIETKQHSFDFDTTTKHT